MWCVSWLLFVLGDMEESDWIDLILAINPLVAESNFILID